MTTDPVVQALILLARRGRALRLAQQQAAAAGPGSEAHPAPTANVPSPQAENTLSIPQLASDTNAE